VTEDCIRCGDAAPVNEDGYCGNCYWEVFFEISNGLHRLRDYLGRWAEFREWEICHSQHLSRR
jgi:hypothetical protein